MTDIAIFDPDVNQNRIPIFFSNGDGIFRYRNYCFEDPKDWIPEDINWPDSRSMYSYKYQQDWSCCR